MMAALVAGLWVLSILLIIAFNHRRRVLPDTYPGRTNGARRTRAPITLERRVELLEANLEWTKGDLRQLRGKITGGLRVGPRDDDDVDEQLEQLEDDELVGDEDELDDDDDQNGFDDDEVEAAYQDELKRRKSHG